jgi:hypothetical protein
MSDPRSLLERESRRFAQPDGAFERLVQRRDRKRRNQRIAAGVVGIAVFVAAIWIVTSGGSLDHSETSVVPGGSGSEPAETGPTETGPTETGPTVTGPGTGSTRNPSSVGFGGLPPEGATPSKPLRGELVMKDSGFGPLHYVNLYADGRLIWTRRVEIPGVSGGPIVTRWIEQRLTPEGVELLRSGAVPLGGGSENPAQGLPASAWEDRTLRPYVPSRYKLCFVKGGENGTPSLADLLPTEAQELLGGAEHVVNTWGCRSLEVTTEDVRSLVEILSDAGYELIGDQPEEQPVDGGPGGFWMSTDIEGGAPYLEFKTVLPDGSSDYPVGF